MRGIRDPHQSPEGTSNWIKASEVQLKNGVDSFLATFAA